VRQKDLWGLVLVVVVGKYKLLHPCMLGATTKEQKRSCNCKHQGAHAAAAARWPGTPTTCCDRAAVFGARPSKPKHRRSGSRSRL
jgi:hypothetical protein